MAALSPIAIYNPNPQIVVPSEDREDFQNARKYLIAYPHHYYTFSGKREVMTDERIYRIMKECMNTLTDAVNAPITKKTYGRYTALSQFTYTHLNGMQNCIALNITPHQMALTQHIGIRTVQQSITDSLFIFIMRNQ